MVTNKPDIASVVHAEGVELKQKGRYFWGLCPLHSERTPSFCVDPERQKFKCFGCGASGDVITFIMQLKQLSYPETLKYLGILGNARPVMLSLREAKRRELVHKFRDWCSNYSKWLGEMLRLCNQIDALVVSSGQLEIGGLAEMYFCKDIYQYHISILQGKDDDLTFRLYKEVLNGQ